MSEEIAPIPEGVLPPVLKELKEKILTDPDIAWIFLRQNPIAVIALSKAKIELAAVDKTMEENHNYQKFMEKLQNSTAEIFSSNHILERDGLALTTELLLEVWRKQNQEIRIHSMNKQLLRELLHIHEKTQKLPNTPENRVVREMVFDSLKRISGLDTYERNKSSDHWNVLSPSMKELIEKSFQEPPSDEIPRMWEAWLGLASLNNNTAEEFRKGLATIVLEQVKSVFPDVDESLKYKLAPWILILEKIIELSTSKDSPPTE
ncbi:MAG: hypothetical protein ACXAD7_23720 [Candidatus Kariarchaeaceae archaeon]|jgi:hypothetical protein